MHKLHLLLFSKKFSNGGALTIDTNLILGPKDFDTLKLSASYEPKFSASLESHVPSPNEIIITVITDAGTYFGLIHEECPF
jgi:hypothetical protein